jgi:hypothetical protein
VSRPVFEHAHDDPPFTGNVPLVVVGQALLARPRGDKGFESEIIEPLVHLRRPGVDVGDEP